MNNETSKPKHTQGPWKVIRNGLGIFGIGVDDISVIPKWFFGGGKQKTIKRIAHEMTVEDAERACSCVNALESQNVTNPKEWVDHMVASQEHNEALIVDLLKYKTACEAINKDNPMAVAENLEYMVELLLTIKKLKPIWSNQKVSEDKLGGAVGLMLAFDQLQELLTKIQAK